MQDSARSSNQWSGRNMGYMISVLPKDAPLSCAITGASNVTLKPGDYVEVEVTPHEEIFFCYDLNVIVVSDLSGEQKTKNFPL